MVSTGMVIGGWRVEFQQVLSAKLKSPGTSEVFCRFPDEPAQEPYTQDVAAIGVVCICIDQLASEFNPRNYPHSLDIVEPHGI